MHLLYYETIVLIACSVGCTSTAQDVLDENRRFLDDETYWGQWSGYSACSASCGKSFATRTRRCFSKTNNRNPQCLGDAYDLLACAPKPCEACEDSNGACVNYDRSVCRNYPEWARDNCQKFCGLCTDGTVTKPPQPTTTTTTTTTTAAPVRHNGAWTSWTSFSRCSATCGPGSMNRYRTCSNPVPSGGGAYCIGAGKETYGCFVQSCPTTPAPYTDWGPWSSYGACSVTCGTGESVRERYRYCTDRSQCKLIGYDRTNCTKTPCPVDGNWANWSTWSKCSASCDLGVITRTRSCDNPAPAHGGAACVGDNTSSRDCTMGQCPVWSHWFPGDCSASCGNGTRERLRHCSTGRDIDCVGKPYETVPCLEAICV